MRKTIYRILVLVLQRRGFSKQTGCSNAKERELTKLCPCSTQHGLKYEKRIYLLKIETLYVVYLAWLYPAETSPILLKRKVLFLRWFSTPFASHCHSHPVNPTPLLVMSLAWRHGCTTTTIVVCCGGTLCCNLPTTQTNKPRNQEAAPRMRIALTFYIPCDCSSLWYRRGKGC